MQDGYQLYTKYIKLGLTPDPDISLPDWSDTYRQLPKGVAREHGKYRTSRTPYLREIMECLSIKSPIQKIVFMKATQIGATEIGNNWLMYIAHKYPSSCLAIFPTVDLALRHSKKKLGPSIKHTPEIFEVFGDPDLKTSGNTLLIKEYRGGSLTLGGANSGTSFRSDSVQYGMGDDIDEFPDDVGGQGDPLVLLGKRTDSYGDDKKLYLVSTPTERDLSRIEKLFKDSDQRYYHVPCPMCGYPQRLIWGGPEKKFGIKFERQGSGILIPESVRYVCKNCTKDIFETSKTMMLENGLWVPTYPERSLTLERGYQLSSLYSPVGWVSWVQMVKEFLEAKKYPESMKAYINTRLGEPSGSETERPSWEVLRNRADSYKSFTVPKGGLVLTSGIDVQDDRLAVIIKAWGNDMESWLIFWGEIFGTPKDKSTWDELSGLLNRTFQGIDGHPFIVQCTAIDTGYSTHDVYNYVRSKAILRAMAIKGASTARKPILGRPSKQDVNYKGTVIKHGVDLWPIGTDTAKALIYARLTIKQPGPGMLHFPSDLDDDYYIQLTSQKKVIKYKDGFPSYNWVLPSGSRDEALDCEVYALAAALRIGLGRKLMKSFNPRMQKMISKTTGRNVGGSVGSGRKRKRLKTRVR